MKNLSIFLTIALMAIIYSCGNNEKGSNEQKTDSLATETAKQTQKQAQPSMTEAEKAELYKYFSKEEISKNMQHAMTVFDTAKINKDDPYMSDFPYLYSKLLEEDGWVLEPKQIVAKWGKPTKEEKNTYEHPLTTEEQVHKYSYVYPHFELSTSDLSSWQPESLSTSTPGFGFVGVYVGIPECNKAFIEKLFAKSAGIEKNEVEGVERWNIFIFGPTMTELTLEFNTDGTVKSMSYFSTNYVG